MRKKYYTVSNNQKHKVYLYEDKIENQIKKYYEWQRKLQFSFVVPIQSTFDDYFICSRTYINELLEEMKELEERIENVKTDWEYNLWQKDSENEEKLRQMGFELEKVQQWGRDRYDILWVKLSQ